MLLKTILITLLTALLSYVALQFLPWWSNLIVAFIIVLAIPVKPSWAFASTALGAGLCWLILAIIADRGNEHILSTRMAGLFGLPAYWMIIAVTAIAGGITGGLGGWLAGILKTKANNN